MNDIYTKNAGDDIQTDAKEDDQMRAGHLARLAFIGAGGFFLGIGIIGIVLPVLPTAPFLLIAGLFFGKSSRKLHNWIRTSKLTGESYKRIINREGMTLSLKLGILAFAWTMLLLAAIFLAKSTAMRIVYPSLGVIKTLLFFTVIKTAPPQKALRKKNKSEGPSFYQPYTRAFPSRFHRFFGYYSYHSNKRLIKN
jgi:uncharacterized protein